MIKRVVLYYFIVQLQHIYPKSGYQEFLFIFVIPKKGKRLKSYSSPESKFSNLFIVSVQIRY